MWARLTQIPPMALRLGLAGVIPFAACAMFAVLDSEADPLLVTHAAGSYALTILCFMSGCIWAFAARQDDPYGIALSTLPTLLGWGGFVLFLSGFLSAFSLFALMALLFAALLALDLRAARAGQTPTWWMSLRLLLSSLVVISLMRLAQASVS